MSCSVLFCHGYIKSRNIIPSLPTWVNSFEVRMNEKGAYFRQNSMGSRTKWPMLCLDPWPMTRRQTRCSRDTSIRWANWLWVDGANAMDTPADAPMIKWAKYENRQWSWRFVWFSTLVTANITRWAPNASSASLFTTIGHGPGPRPDRPTPASVRSRHYYSNNRWKFSFVYESPPIFKSEWLIPLGWFGNSLSRHSAVLI